MEGRVTGRVDKSGVEGPAYSVMHTDCCPSAPKPYVPSTTVVSIEHHICDLK